MKKARNSWIPSSCDKACYFESIIIQVCMIIVYMDVIFELLRVLGEGPSCYAEVGLCFPSLFLSSKR